MNRCVAIPPIEELIPHRGSMLLLDRVVAYDAEYACAEYSPRPDAWYADENGNMPAWIGIELMAQTVAAQVGLVKRREGLPNKQGVLLGTRCYAAMRPSFPANNVLRVHAQITLCDASGLGAYECRIESEGTSLATATLKVFEPDDFQQFMQSNPQ